MTSHEWLRAVEVWSPFPKVSWDCFFTEEEHFEAVADALAHTFPPEVFCEATVKAAARRCETFPNYYWCCKVLESRA